MQKVYLLLGSNLGDRENWLAEARRLIAERVSVPVMISSIYQTEAWGKTGEPDYLNQVVMLLSALDPHAILKEILNIERDLGRQRKGKWDSRIIDIDILFYGDLVLDEPDLTIPHKYVHERRFALAPLIELSPNLLHPELKKTVSELNKSLPDKLVVHQIKN